MFYPGLLDFYCPVSEDLLNLAQTASEPETADCHDTGENGEDNFVSPELFEDPSGGSEGEGKLEAVAKPPLKETITKLVAEGSLSHQQVGVLESLLDYSLFERAT